MKTNSTLKSYKPLKRGNGFKKKSRMVWSKGILTPEDKLKPVHPKRWPLKNYSFNRTPSELQREVRELDSKFSKFIINRDKHCLRCLVTCMNTCSHFYPRAIWATRYEPDNCVDFCVTCHDEWESKKGAEYQDFMIELLGIERFNHLENMSKVRITKREALDKAKILLKGVEDNSDIQY